MLGEAAQRALQVLQTLNEPLPLHRQGERELHLRRTNRCEHVGAEVILEVLVILKLRRRGVWSAIDAGVSRLTCRRSKVRR